VRVALFKKEGDAPLTIGNELNHLAFNVAGGTYESLKAELESLGVAVSDGLRAIRDALADTPHDTPGRRSAVKGLG
jgi:hypothetical protein